MSGKSHGVRISDPARRDSVDVPLTTVKRSEKDIVNFAKDAASTEVNYFQGSNLSIRAVSVVNNGQLEEVGAHIRTEFGGSIKFIFAGKLDP